MNFLKPGANAFLNETALPATLYVQLHTGNPGVNGTANVATTSTREDFTRTTSTDGAADNDVLIQWASAAATQQITHATIWGASSGGTAWLGGLINGGVAIEVQSGLPINIQIGQLGLSLDLWS